MKTVTVEISWLLSKLAANRSAHKADYKLARQGYKDECIKQLQEQMDKIVADSNHDVYIEETPPKSYVATYDTAILMLNASVDSEVELTSIEFRSYVEDNWEWKDAWQYSNTKYLGNSLD